MTAFDRREEAFERKFAHDEELRFRAEARRDKFLGAWAAEKLGKTGQEAEAYAAEMLAAAVAGPGEERLFAKLRSDFDRAGVHLSDHQIRREMDTSMQKALNETQKYG